jgi:hypothetical protein
MSSAAIDYIWKAIQESERSNKLQFMDNEMLITAAAHGPARPRTDQSSAAGCESIVEAAIDPKPVDSDLLQAVTPPPLPRP